jgi:hypothetical protein
METSITLIHELKSLICFVGDGNSSLLGYCEGWAVALIEYKRNLSNLSQTVQNLRFQLGASHDRFVAKHELLEQCVVDCCSLLEQRAAQHSAALDQVVAEQTQLREEIVVGHEQHIAELSRAHEQVIAELSRAHE